MKSNLHSKRRSKQKSSPQSRVLRWPTSKLLHHRRLEHAVSPSPPFFLILRSNFLLNLLTCLSSCDVIIMAIPMPVLWRLQVSLRRKLALSSLFCSGIFIIVCTILRTYFVLGDSSNQLLGQQWAEREGFVSMIVISAPGIWPIFRQSGLFGSSGRDTGPSRDRNAPRSLFTFRPSRRPPSTDMHRDVDDDCELVPWSDPKDLERRCSFKSEEAKTESHHSLEQENRRMSIIVTKEYDVRYQSGSRPSLPPHPGCQPLG